MPPFSASSLQFDFADLPRYPVVAGLDEAGRGCLAGPVVAGAVIWDSAIGCGPVTDSKKLNERQRQEAEEYIKEHAVAWSVGFALAEEIDRINILQASFLAMNRAVQGLKTRPDALVVDGNRFRAQHDIPWCCLPKADDLVLCVGAASILAKTFRDRWMAALHELQPQYNWIQNKGYPTPEHVAALQAHGAVDCHRQTFAPVMLLGQGELVFEEL